MTVKCCWTNQRTKEPCDHAPEWEIHYGNNPCVFSLACTKHVGKMLSDNHEHRIYHYKEEDKDNGNR